MDKRKIEFRAQFLEDSRKHMISDNVAQMLYKHIGVNPGQKIVDVGCGTGFFTRLIAKYAGKQSSIVGVDIDRELLKVAERKSSEDDVNVSYIVHDARDISNAFSSDNDLVICHFLLSRVPRTDALSIIDEMIKVCRPGGVVAALEPCLGAMVALFDGDPALSRKLSAMRQIKSTVQETINDIDENIGISLPSLFAEKKLVNIETEIIALRWWTPLPFNPQDMDNDMREWYQRRLDSLGKPNDKKIVQQYGKHDDAAAGLRYNSAETPEQDNELVNKYRDYGINPEDLVDLGDRRIGRIRSLLGGEIQNKMISDFEIIPAFAVVGRKSQDIS